MPSERFRFVRALTASALVATFAMPRGLVAEVSDHLVSSTDMQTAAVNASSARQQNLQALESVFASDKARHALESAHMNPQQVTKAIASLSDDQLAQLSERTKKAQSDFAAGTLSERDLIVILLLVAVLILVIVAVR